MTQATTSTGGASIPLVVLDTSAIVGALLGNANGVNAKALAAVRDGHARLATSPAWLAEVSDVLNRPALTKRIGASRVQEVVSNLWFGGTRYQPAKYTWGLRDPNDEWVLDLAFEAGADLIVSRDNDLLVEGPPRGFVVLDPPAFLRHLGL